MRKIFRHTLTPVAMLMILGACDKDGVEPVVLRDFPTFTATIDGGHARAIDDYWEIGDRIGISGSNAVNICHITPNGEANFEVEDPAQQYFFQNNNPVEFTAYYPYKSELSTTDAYTITTEDQLNQKAFDFLWAKAEGGKASPDVKFEFKHKMSKVSFVFISGKNMEVTTITKYRLNGLINEGTFSLSTGICSANSGAAKSAVTMNLENSYIQGVDRIEAPSLILFPQTVNSDIKLEIFDNLEQHFVCNLTVPDNVLLAGDNCTFTITVNKTGLAVTNCTITDWISTEGEDSEASSSDE